MGRDLAGRPAASAYAPTRRAMRVLPMGVGLVLVGLGFGFLGLRLRRPGAR
ncbi:hypothetical protein ACFO3J_22540 [Streptomyces polygonati]|uniref:Uncharacterized protein n=1 Tax=Streptomyces polygonati TaxID=1617087 RepID=A0ABV8HWJ3_9ACTN